MELWTKMGQSFYGIRYLYAAWEIMTLRIVIHYNSCKVTTSEKEWLFFTLQLLKDLL